MTLEKAYFYERADMPTEFDKDINAEDQFIEADQRDEANSNTPEYYSLVVRECLDMVSMHLEDEMGNITPIGLFDPSSETRIQTEINQMLDKYPKLWIQWEHPKFAGVHFQIRRGDGSKERFFRTPTRGLQESFARRRIYAERNPGSTVSFTQFPIENQS